MFQLEMYYVYSIIVGGLVGFALYTVLGSVRFKNNTVRLVVSVIFGISVFTMLTLQTEGFETISAYDNGKVYRVGDKVTKDGQTYVMIDGIGAPGYPPPRPTNWSLVPTQASTATAPAYDNGKVYRVGDKVTKDGQTYVMIDGIGAPGYPPPRPTNWSLVPPPPPPPIAPKLPSPIAPKLPSPPPRLPPPVAPKLPSPPPKLPVVAPRSVPSVIPSVPRPIPPPTVVPMVAPTVVPMVAPTVAPMVVPIQIYANHTTCSQFGGSIDSTGLCSF